MSDTSPETPATSEPTAPITAPGATAAVPQEQLDRAVELLLHAMQLRNYVELHRGRLPAELVRRWDAWYRGLAEVFQRAQADSIAQRQVLAQLPTYQAELARYRGAFAAHGGSPPGGSRERRSSLSPPLVGGAGLAVGLVVGFVVAGSRS